MKAPQITVIFASGPWGRGVMHLISPLGGKGLKLASDCLLVEWSPDNYLTLNVHVVDHFQNLYLTWLSVVFNRFYSFKMSVVDKDTRKPCARCHNLCQ